MQVDIDVRERREAIVQEHVEAENRQDVDATLDTFHHPRFEVVPLGRVGDGEEAVRELYEGLFSGFPDLNLEINSLRHAEDAVILEVHLTGSHQGEWAGISATGHRIGVPIAAFFLFDEDRLEVERVYFDVATFMRQLGVGQAT